jgi:6-phosphogluconolactonase
MTIRAVEVFDDSEALAAGAAAAIAEQLRDAPGPRVSIGMAGGSSPAATYRQLRGLPCRWERVDAWLSDERYVPLDHRDSNGAMVADALLNHVAATFLRPRWAPWLEPEESAAHYEAALRSMHPVEHPPDVILLGLGDDGHTASLFPLTPALSAEHRWYVSNFVPTHESWRLTSTFELIGLARQVFFIVAGETKAGMVARVINDDGLPAATVTRGPSPVTWLLDAGAASRLRG